MSSPPSSATVLSAIQLPSVKVSHLPPLTERSGEPGSSGTVFKTTFQGRVVAAKIYHEHTLKTLRRELRALNLLVHGNIVRILAVLTNDLLEPVGFIMEYMPLSVETAMPQLTLTQAINILCGASLGLAVTHDNGIIHADIKPGNILLSDDCSDVKLADFGLSKALTSLLASQSGGVRGTSLFIAPEHLDGAPMSMMCDTFSFGMTCWQIFHPTVTNPLGTTPTQIMFKLAQGKRPLITRDDLPSAMRQLIEACLAHEPQDRPPSMWDVHRALVRIRSQLPAADSAPSTLAQLLPHFPCPVSLQPSTLSFTDIPSSDPLYGFILERARSFPPSFSVSRISRVNCPRMREASFCDLVSCDPPPLPPPLHFLHESHSAFNLFCVPTAPFPSLRLSLISHVHIRREVRSRANNPILRPENPKDNPDFTSGLAVLQSAFEPSIFGSKPPVGPLLISQQRCCSL
jgi:serine/threonine protein kinase